MIRFNRVSLQDNGLFLDLIKQKAFCILQKAFIFILFTHNYTFVFRFACKKFFAVSADGIGVFVHLYIIASAADMYF